MTRRQQGRHREGRDRNRIRSGIRPSGAQQSTGPEEVGHAAGLSAEIPPGKGGSGRGKLSWRSGRPEPDPALRKGWRRPFSCALRHSDKTALRRGRGSSREVPEFPRRRPPQRSRRFRSLSRRPEAPDKGSPAGRGKGSRKQRAMIVKSQSQRRDRPHRSESQLREGVPFRGGRSTRVCRGSPQWSRREGVRLRGQGAFTTGVRTIFRYFTEV